jgi:hypothetical protein
MDHSFEHLHPITATTAPTTPATHLLWGFMGNIHSVKRRGKGAKRFAFLEIRHEELRNFWSFDVLCCCCFFTFEIGLFAVHEIHCNASIWIWRQESETGTEKRAKIVSSSHLASTASMHS